MSSDYTVDFKAVLEAAPALYLLLAPDPPRFTILGGSDAYLQATHTTRDGPKSILGREMFEVFPDPPGDRAATGTRNLRASLLRALDGRTPDVMPVQYYSIRRPDGSWEERHWAPRNTPVFLPDGRVHCLIHEVVDVTPLVKAQEAARKAQESFESAREALRAAEAELGRERALLRDAHLMHAELREESNRLRAESERLRNEMRELLPRGGRPSGGDESARPSKR